ncbi:AraC family ligand binding domain-containing protein [Flavobacterium agricola]|uniref:AraC family ligand binding domain-containing protein n=1 Tax=Flavobacterium agricola TaxID=2870839 RepID=A0ABY6M516_9FLAO|nr:AraC family ligand binding domain-containing protein [Flavobacterium agricola]UYW02378.1 AraC family ligand binding domain-containing protein [Flavobacterium agricola]
MLSFKLKQIIEKKEDEKLSFRVFDLNADRIKTYATPHQNDHFFILIVEEGTIELQIEDQHYLLNSGKISVVFPNQAHYIQSKSKNFLGKIILFEEVLFCSDILKNELSVYNVNLSTQLNCIVLDANTFTESMQVIKTVQEIYNKPGLIKKEQARFYIKTFLLTLIESVHGQHPILGQQTADQPLYVQFKKLLNEHYKTERTVQFYADQLYITTKKLNAITKKHCGETAINTIHHRLMIEIKRQLMFTKNNR